MLKNFIFEADIQKIINNKENSQHIVQLLSNFEKDVGNKRVAERFVSWVALQLRKKEKEDNRAVDKLYKEIILNLRAVSYLPFKEVQKINPFELKSHKELNDVVDDSGSAFLRAENATNGEDLEKIFENDEVLVINVKTFRGSYYLSQGQDEWCTSGDECHFEDYFNKGPIFRLYLKRHNVPEKYKRCSLSIKAQKPTFLHYENREFDPVSKKILSKSTTENILKIYKEKQTEQLQRLDILDLFIYGASAEVINQKINNMPDVDVEDEDGQTPLIWACKVNNLELAKLLINKGADTNRKDQDDLSCLELAYHYKNFDLAKLLLEHGADVNKAFLSGLPPLNIAFQNNEMSFFKLFIEYGADVNFVNEKGETLLHQDVFYNNIKPAMLLINNGINVNIKDNVGKTPLLWACSDSNLELVKILVEHGAIVDMSDFAGKTPLFWACEYNNLELINYLIKHGAKVTNKELEHCRDEQIKSILKTHINEIHILKKYIF